MFIYHKGFFMNSNKFLISLSNSKSQTHILVDSDTYYWVVGGGKIPTLVKTLILESKIMGEEELDDWLSEYHSDNDRALLIPCIQSFKNISTLHEYLKNNNVTILNSYEGIFY